LTDTFDADGEPVEVADVVQIDPDADAVFGGCLLTVTETLGWAVSGFVTIPDPSGHQLTRYRADWRTFKRIGRAAYTQPEGA
jgi:hypothetical protein